MKLHQNRINNHIRIHDYPTSPSTAYMPKMPEESGKADCAVNNSNSLPINLLEPGTGV
jgi:hypothetical protein